MYIRRMATIQTFAGDVMSDPVAVTEHNRTEQQHRIEHTAVAATLGWAGWGSPVGLGVLITAIGFFVLCLHWAGVIH
jgi:hypothetical protein